MIGQNGTFFRAAFGQDGRPIALAEYMGMLLLWDAGTDQLLRRFEGHTEAILDVALNPDGDRLASASADGTIRLWRFDSDQLLGILKDDSCGTSSIAYSPDGRTLASGGDDVLCFWDVDTRRLVRIIEDGGGRKSRVLFSPDGRFLASGGEAGAVLWTLPTLAMQLGPIQTAVVATRTAFPVEGSLLVAGGRWMLGIVDQPLTIPVTFQAESPFAEVTEMRTAEQERLSEEEMALIPWEPFAPEQAFQFTPTVANWFSFGVSVQFRDAKGNLSPVYYGYTSVEGYIPWPTRTATAP
jgi:hypothetical protein